MPMPFGLPPPNPAIELFAASHGMSQGLLQSAGPQIIPRASVRIGAVQAGAQWRNIDSPAASGIAALFVKLSRKQGKAQVDLAALCRIRTDARAGVVRHAWEFDATLRRSFGKLAVRLNAEYAPSEFEAGRSLYVELGPSVEIAKGTNLFANVGRRERDGTPDYTAFNAGVSQAVGHKLIVDGRYYATDRGRLGERYRGRFVVSLRLSL